MPTYDKCPPAVVEMANAILCEFETHAPILDAKVKIDFLFAFGDPEKDEPAITKNGIPCDGLCRKIPLKDRVAGRGDAEILLDGDFWNAADEPERRALLDHELHHISVMEGERDSAGRPKLRLRKHDVEVGWFSIIAERHGRASGERRQAKNIFDRFGQAFWPDLMNAKPAQEGRFKQVARATV